MWSAKRIVGVAVCAMLGALAPSGQADEAHAQETGTTTFNVSYMQVADDCDGKGMSLSTGSIELSSPAKGKVIVKVPGLPAMNGNRAKRKFKAQATGPASQPNIRGKYSASGKVGKGKIQMVFIAEFYKGKKPLCTQSWSAQGTRK